MGSHVKVVPPRTPGIIRTGPPPPFALQCQCSTVQLSGSAAAAVAASSSALRPSRRPSGPAPRPYLWRMHIAHAFSSQSSPQTKVAIPALLPSHAKPSSAPGVLADPWPCLAARKGNRINTGWTVSMASRQGRHATDTGLLPALQAVVACRNGLAQARQLLVCVQVEASTYATNCRAGRRL